MLYRKNIYHWEQWSRVVVGLAASVSGLFLAPSHLVAYGVAAAGIGLAVTGVVGWCPACAMIDRRLKDQP